MDNAYDQVHYPSHPFAQTHPDQLATVATLFGMRPAPVENCRVLELGCGAGGNLVPMAFHLPGSAFTGIDLARSAIAEGCRMISDLGLRNIDVRAANLLDLDDSIGEFDYIIAHGLYSWVPDEVKHKLLQIASRRLASQGVVYISYNAQPGGHIRQIVRDLMLYLGAGAGEPADRLQAARAALELLAGYEGENRYRLTIRDEARYALDKQPALMFHDELSPVYDSVYFHEFVDDAAAHGLQYLGEAIYSEMMPRIETSAVQAVEQMAGDNAIAREQLFDFLRCRKFRQTLLCHADVKLQAPEPAVIRSMYISSPAQLIEGAAGDVEEFRTSRGAAVKTAHPLVKAAMHALCDAAPEAIPFADLLDRTAPAQAEVLSELLLAAARSGVIELHVWPAPCVRAAGERPRVGELARYEAQGGRPISTETHEVIEAVGDVERRLIAAMDGTRTREQLADMVAELIEPVPPREELMRQLEDSLTRLAKMGLMQG